VRDIAHIPQHLAAARSVEPSHDAQQTRLARAQTPQQRRKGSKREAEIDAVELKLTLYLLTDVS
jgi:hypothetical protein